MNKPETHIKQYTDKHGNTIRLEGDVPLEVKKNGAYWIIYSPHFKTFGYSHESEQKAVEDFDTAIKLFFEIHIERGTLEKALILYGWERTNNVFSKRKLFNTPVKRTTRQYALS